MSHRPPGLKVYPALLTGAPLLTLREQCRSLPPPPFSPLFRYFGDFGENARVEPMAPWMPALGRLMVAQGLFDALPNQYRVTNWQGELSAHFKWHIDNHRHGEEILVISLTDGRSLGFRDPRRPEREPFVLSQDAGDAYVIRGGARWKWEHKVMPTGQDRGGGESFVMAHRRT